MRNINHSEESLNLKWMQETSDFLEKAQAELDTRNRLISAFWTGVASGDKNGDSSLEEIIMAQWGRKRIESLQHQEG